MACWVTAGLLRYGRASQFGMKGRMLATAVLEGLQSEVSEGSGQLSGDSVSHGSRHHDTPRLRNTFETSGNVDR